jgi:hypothetical protein
MSLTVPHQPAPAATEAGPDLADLTADLAALAAAGRIHHADAALLQQVLHADGDAQLEARVDALAVLTRRCQLDHGQATEVETIWVLYQVLRAVAPSWCPRLYAQACRHHHSDPDTGDRPCRRWTAAALTMAQSPEQLITSARDEGLLDAEQARLLLGGLRGPADASRARALRRRVALGVLAERATLTCPEPASETVLALRWALAGPACTDGLWDLLQQQVEIAGDPDRGEEAREEARLEQLRLLDLMAGVAEVDLIGGADR